MTVRIQDFAPLENYKLSPSTSSQNQAFTTNASPSTTNYPQGTDLMVYNGTSSLMYVQWGNSSQTATTSSAWVPPNSTVIFNCGPVNNVAYMLDATASGNAWMSLGQGA